MEENRNTSFQLKGRDMDSILQSLEEGVSEIFTSERYTEYLQTMAKFHNYSFNNTMLIALAAAGCNACDRIPELAVYGTSGHEGRERDYDYCPDADQEKADAGSLGQGRASGSE